MEEPEKPYLARYENRFTREHVYGFEDSFGDLHLFVEGRFIIFEDLEDIESEHGWDHVYHVVCYEDDNRIPLEEAEDAWNAFQLEECSRRLADNIHPTKREHFEKHFGVSIQELIKEALQPRISDEKPSPKTKT